MKSFKVGQLVTTCSTGSGSSILKYKLSNLKSFKVWDFLLSRSSHLSFTSVHDVWNSQLFMCRHKVCLRHSHVCSTTFSTDDSNRLLNNSAAAMHMLFHSSCTGTDHINIRRFVFHPAPTLPLFDRCLSIKVREWCASMCHVEPFVCRFSVDLYNTQADFTH